METNYFEISTLPLYCIGFLTFICTLIDDWLNPSRKIKRFLYYVQEFLYTGISIALGISVCIAMETSQSISWIVSIIMGLCGSTIIRTIRNKREDIGNSVVDKIKDTIRNPGKKSRSSDDNVLESEINGDEPYQSYDDVCSDSGFMEEETTEETEETAEQRMKEKFAAINKSKK